METKFSQVATHEALQEIISDSFTHPIVVFKHSNRCPISSAAYREMQKLNGEVSMVDVNSSRNISEEFARVTGIKHESPQVIILRNGNAVWNASHFDVQASAIKEAVDANG